MTTIASNSSTGRTWLGLVGWLGLCFAAAWIGARFMPGPWFERLQKPDWNPPAWVFGPVWTVLYLGWVTFATALNFAIWQLNA